MKRWCYLSTERYVGNDRTLTSAFGQCWLEWSRGSRAWTRDRTLARVTPARQVICWRPSDAVDLTPSKQCSQSGAGDDVSIAHEKKRAQDWPDSGRVRSYAIGRIRSRKTLSGYLVEMTGRHVEQCLVLCVGASGHHFDRDVDWLVTVRIERLEFEQGHMVGIGALGL
jgi:hypothetical protein